MRSMENVGKIQYAKLNVIRMSLTPTLPVKKKSYTPCKKKRLDIVISIGSEEDEHAGSLTHTRFQYTPSITYGR